MKEHFVFCELYFEEKYAAVHGEIMHSFFEYAKDGLFNGSDAGSIVIIDITTEKG